MPDTVSATVLDSLLQGQVVRPDDNDYDTVRTVWNGMVDRRPALIARCGTAQDVVKAIAFAKAKGLAISVRGGGHGVAGNAVCDKGLMIDLSLMRAVSVDPLARTARVGPGAKLGDVDGAAQAHGLATTLGADSRTGVAGLTLGGGMGLLGRSFGLAIDNLIGAEVALADGRLIRANATSHADLFWALRGGGGNFGIVTEFEFRLHPLGPEIMTAQVFYAMETAGTVLRAYRDFMAKAPDELACYAVCVPIPPVDPFPADLHGKTACALVGCYSGSIAEGQKLLAPLGRFADPLVATLAPVAYTLLQQSFDAGAPDGKRYYWKSHYLNRLSDEVIDIVLRFAPNLPGPYSNVFFESMGGAISRVPADATAFPHRQAPFSIGISSGWEDEDQDAAAIAWTRAFHQALVPHGTGVYANYLDFDETERVAAAYGSNYARLRTIKGTYDLENLFRLTQNIAPAA